MYVCMCVMFIAGHLPIDGSASYLYTIIGLDPEGGQWLFKFKSNHNKKINRQNCKHSICGM